MARYKDVTWQRDMSAMETREDMLEADDSELRGKSLRSAKNMRALATRVLEARPGTYDIGVADTAEHLVEIQPADGEIYGLMFLTGELRVIDYTGATVYSTTDVPWTVHARNVWAVPFRERTIIGAPKNGIYALEYDGTNWAFGEFALDEGPGGSLLQPYWNFNPGTRIRPSARTGAVTIDSPEGVFKPGHVGTRITYGGSEIEITGYTDAQNVSGNVIQPLPPSYKLTVSDTSEIRVGDVVIGQDTNFNGIVTFIVDATKFHVLTREFYDGPDVNEKISLPSTTLTVTAKEGMNPFYTTLWKEQLMSDLRGYPRSASSAAGRLVLVDFPLIPDLIVASSTRSVADFGMGVEDDDGIMRQEGENAPRFLHAITAGDLLLFSDRGCYLVPLRDGSAMTPRTFNAVLFDRRGCSSVRPVQVDDGVVFVEASSETVSAALLDGNVYLKWSVRNLTTFHHHLIKNPVALCGPALSSPVAEKYLFVVNGDGTMAAVSWSTEFGQEGVGFAPWVTDGAFRQVSPIFGEYWALVDRTVGGVEQRRMERFDYGAHVDAAVFDDPNVAGVAPHLAGKEAAVVWRDAYAGTATVANDGSLLGMEDVTGKAQIGLDFEAEVSPWPVEKMESPRIGTFAARCIRFMVSVQNTGAFTIRCNKDSRIVGGYAFGDDVSKAPPLRTDIFRAPVFGRRTHPDLAVVKHQPGPFRILALAQEVQG